MLRSSRNSKFFLYQLNSIFKRYFSNETKTKISSIEEFNLENVLKPENKTYFENNIQNRKGIGNIQLIHELYTKFISTTDTSLRENLERELCMALKMLPNETSSHVSDLKEPKLLKYFGEKRTFSKNVYSFREIATKLNLLRLENLSNFVGPRSYYLLGDLAHLEQALIEYTLDKLLSRKFQIITVPETLHGDVIENCGMNLNGERTQVFRLDQNLHESDICLSGTAEMAIGGYLSNKKFQKKDLPLRLVAVSRCFRAETSKIAEEKAIFRVHQFYKVEMFAVTAQGESSSTLEEFRNIQEELFSELGLHCRILDMPPHELGAAAYRKYDIEAWLPSQQNYFEISSASDCTDFQAKRLNIMVDTEDSNTNEYCCTVNGTACAIPRMIMAIIENCQPEKKKDPIQLPSVLWPFMPNNQKGITISSQPLPKYIKTKL